jgi:hypothetical protein
LRGWLGERGFIARDRYAPLAWPAHALKLLSLVVTVAVAAGALGGVHQSRSPLRVIAGAAIAAHLPMLFIFDTHYRYAMLGWDLSLLVAIVWWARLGRPVPATMRVSNPVAG